MGGDDTVTSKAASAGPLRTSGAVEELLAAPPLPPLSEVVLRQKQLQPPHAKSLKKRGKLSSSVGVSVRLTTTASAATDPAPMPIVVSMPIGKVATPAKQRLSVVPETSTVWPAAPIMSSTAATGVAPRGNGLFAPCTCSGLGWAWGRG